MASSPSPWWERVFEDQFGPPATLPDPFWEVAPHPRYWLSTAAVTVFYLNTVTAVMYCTWHSDCRGLRRPNPDIVSIAPPTRGGLRSTNSICVTKASLHSCKVMCKVALTHRDSARAHNLRPLRPHVGQARPEGFQRYALITCVRGVVHPGMRRAFRSGDVEVDTWRLDGALPACVLEAAGGL